jgi:hypothetical protein
MAKMRTTSGKTVDVKMEDLRGRTVRTRRAMSNGWMEIPAGTVCIVTGWWRSGVSLKSEPCPHCKVKASISHVHRDDVLLVDDDNAAADKRTPRADDEDPDGIAYG